MLSFGTLFRASPGMLRWTGVALTLTAVAALILVAANGDWRDLSDTLGAARLEWLAAGMFLALVVEVIKALRWQLLLGAALAQLPELLALVLSAQLLNALTPMRAGDIWRIVFVARAQRRRLVMAGGSVLAEKLCDGAALAAVGLGVVGSASLHIFWLVVVGVCLLGTLSLALRARVCAAPPAWLKTWTVGLHHLPSARALVGTALLTAAGLGLGVLVNLLVLRALNLPESVPTAVIILLTAYAVGVLPAAPGRLGVFELAVASPLIAIGFTAAASVAVAVTLHLVLFSAMLIGGLLALLVGLVERLRRRRTCQEAMNEQVTAS